ncbi:MAG: STAS domain-containing protein, partial [Sciscionella sp.]
DMHTAPELRGCVRELLEPPRGLRLVLDVSGLDFVDSSGLSALIATHKAVTTAGGEVVLAHPTETLLRMITITGLDGVFTIRGDEGGSGSARPA